MKIIEKVAEMNEASCENRKKGLKISLVPTMGYLHDGHISLVKIARANSDIVVLSNFVNPTQFGPNEDYNRYPRDIARDNKICKESGVDIVFAPSVNEMYSKDESIWVYEDKLSKVLCGKSRPNHFRGVCTVVSKLFNIIQPDIAVFGMKDYQQLRIIERMVENLKYPISILRGPIVREKDGLAMSSRNKYLNCEERKNATTIFSSLEDAKNKILNGEKNLEKLKYDIELRISQSGGKIDYIEFMDAENLTPMTNLTAPFALLIAIAAFYGN
ncbi:MAG TPA: pantoate--beta-alanine ligase, partial [Victivallales bacterium]|nr:pantoate--beta-alanine ligase [Victivallales bacterium]